MNSADKLDSDCKHRLNTSMILTESHSFGTNLTHFSTRFHSTEIADLERCAGNIPYVLSYWEAAVIYTQTLNV